MSHSPTVYRPGGDIVERCEQQRGYVLTFKLSNKCNIEFHSTCTIQELKRHNCESFISLPPGGCNVQIPNLNIGIKMFFLKQIV